MGTIGVACAPSNRDSKTQKTQDVGVGRSSNAGILARLSSEFKVARLLKHNETLKHLLAVPPLQALAYGLRREKCS